MTEWLLTSSRRRRHPASQSKKYAKRKLHEHFQHTSQCLRRLSLSLFLGDLIGTVRIYIFTQRLLLDLFPCRCLIFSLALRRLSPLSQFIAPSTLLGLYNSICVTVGLAYYSLLCMFYTIILFPYAKQWQGPTVMQMPFTNLGEPNLFRIVSIKQLTMEPRAFSFLWSHLKWLNLL